MTLLKILVFGAIMNVTLVVGRAGQLETLAWEQCLQGDRLNLIEKLQIELRVEFVAGEEEGIGGLLEHVEEAGSARHEGGQREMLYGLVETGGVHRLDLDFVGWEDRGAAGLIHHLHLVLVHFEPQFQVG